VSDPSSPFDPTQLPTEAIPATGFPPDLGAAGGGEPPVPPGPPAPPADEPGNVPWVPVVLAALAVILLGVIVVLLLSDDDDDTAATTTSAATSTTLVDATTTTAADTTTTSVADTTTSTSTSSTTTTVPEPVDFDVVVFPAEGSGVAFTDPVVAARAFATDYLGFTDLVVGEFAAGDSTSGEVEIRPFVDGVPTVVLLRTFGDTGQWFVTGAANENIVVDTPEPGAIVASPLLLNGSVFAFEGTVNVQILADGETEPLYEGFVTGGGSELLPFESVIEWPAPASGAGAVVFREFGPREGEVLNAAVVRVLFGGTGS
jgi:Immunoglobulin-like domain of bacterial spore germination